MEEETAKIIHNKIVQKCAALYDNEMIHGALTPENVVISKGNIELADYNRPIKNGKLEIKDL